MSLIHQYILEFNKIVGNINFMSASNDVSLKNKLFLIQQDINEDVDFDSFECYNFLSNIYNILNQSSDPKSQIVTSCVEVLQKAITSRNKTIMKTVQDINFLPAITKLLWFVNEDNFNDNLIKLLMLIKKLIMLNNELDEHNLKVFITSLRDLIENFNHSEITKLSLHILANLAMSNESAKYLISRCIRTTEVQDKINKSSDLIAMKFLIISFGEFQPKDIPHLMKLSVLGIQDSIGGYDSEAIIHSIDLIKYAKNIFNNGKYHLSDMSNVMDLFGDLNAKLITHFNCPGPSEANKAFINNIFDYYSLLLECDSKIVSNFAKFTDQVFDNSNFIISSSSLKYLSSYISHGGIYESMDRSIETIIEFFNNNINADPKIIENSQKFEFIKFLRVLHENEKLDNTHFKSVLEYMENTLKIFDDFKMDLIDDDVIQLLVYSLQTLYTLSQDSSLFRECLHKMLDLPILPNVIAKAYLVRDEDILKVLFKLTSMEGFPNVKVAGLLSKSVYTNHDRATYKEVATRGDKTTSKYVTGHLLNELDDLIKRINQKLDNDDLNSLKASDVISLYRQKNNYLQDHLTTVSETLNKYSDFYNKMQQENAILRKLGEKQEILNWGLQLDKEKYLKENQRLETEILQLGSSIATFKSKIDKEIQQNLLMKKQMTVKDMEIEKLRSEKSNMESEKQRFRQAQKENELRIQELKQSLEEEKKLRESEVSNAQAEQKRIAQKAEKEHAKFQEVIKLNENDLREKQQRITELETELKEAEKIQTSILSIMQKSSRK